MEIRDNISIPAQNRAPLMKSLSGDSTPAQIADGVVLGGSPGKEVKKGIPANIASKMMFDKDFTTLAWKADLPCHISPVPVIGADGNAYIGSDNGTLTKFDIKTGKKEWQYYHKDSKKMSEPLFNDQGELILVADLHKVLILDSKSGEKTHEISTDTFSPAAPRWGPNGTIVMMSFPDGIMSKEGSIYALDPRQKPKKSFLKNLYPFYRGGFADKLWEVPLGTKSMDLSVMNPDGKPRNPADIGDTLYYTDGDRKIVALDQSTGKKLWQVAPVGKWLFDPFIIGENMLGAATNDQIMAVEPKTGKTIWSAPCGNIFGAPSSDGKGTVFYRPDPETIVAVRDGKVKWTKKTGFCPLIIPPVTDKFGGVYIVSREGDKNTISALDGETGDLRFKLNSSSNVDSAPVVSPDGRILVKVSDGSRRSLCCFESPFNPDMAAAIPDMKDEIEEGDGWVRIGDIRLDVRKS